MSDIPLLVEEAKRQEHRKNRWLALAGGLVVVGLVFQGVAQAKLANNQDKVLTLSEGNRKLLNERNAQLQAQVDASRVILTQLYAALNASQKQVIDLGGVPIHFEFEVPTTTTTTTVEGSPTSSQNADGPDISVAAAIEALIISPVSVSLPPDVVVPPELTLPPVSIPPEITVPTLPDVTVPPDLTVPLTIGVP